MYWGFGYVLKKVFSLFWVILYKGKFSDQMTMERTLVK